MANAARAVVAAVILSACSQGNGSPALPQGAPARPLARVTNTLIQHVVIIVQENRSVDNLFQFLPGANTASYGLNLKNKEVPLKPEGLAGQYDMLHSHRAWLSAYNKGGMNGWNDELCTGKCPGNAAYRYVPQAQVQPYYDMATAYTFGDEMFQSNQGPSFPAHQYLVSGTSTSYDHSPWRASEDTGDDQGGCDSIPGVRVEMIDAAGGEGHRRFPCFDRTSIFTLLDNAKVSWRYYEAVSGAGPWNAVDALKPLWKSKHEFSANVIAPNSSILTDIADGNLSSVVFVTPTSAESDHSGENKGTGPSWVASVVNAIGSSAYWNNTAVIVTWDDWGGWYDHVTPKIYNSYELGMRVPLIVISPYARVGYVSHVHYEFGSILKFVEKTFNLGSLGTTDRRAKDLSDCFDFTRHGRKFKKIEAEYSREYFLRQPISDQAPGDD
jgi:phospholipase C